MLDLRGNGGGLMVEAINLVNLFIDRDRKVLETRGKITAENYTYRTTDEAWDAIFPLLCWWTKARRHPPKSPAAPCRTMTAPW